MLQNYFILAYRNLFKNRVFSVINIAGLSLGIACCSLLALYIRDEFSFEKHFDGADRIYRITSAIKQGDAAAEVMQRTSPPVAMTMLQEFPELESATRIVNPPEVERHLIRYKDNTFYEKKGFLVDSTFLQVFSFELREGNPATALHGRSTVILSDELASKLFGKEPALNETLIITSGFSVDTFHVTGVLKPMNKKSHVNADFYMSMNSNGWGDVISDMTTWSGQNFIFSYIKLKPGTSPGNLLAKLPALQEKHGGDEMRAMKRQKSLGLQPLMDIRLHSNHFALNLDLSTNGSINYIYIMGSVAIFILLIACINFMNLTTAKATQRAGEVGVRKTMGADRMELIKQFMGESLTIVLIALILAVGLIQIALPVFNAITGRSISLTSENMLFYFGFLIVTGVITGIVAGSYPAFFLSSFQPAQVLKSKNLLSGPTSWMRKGLVVVQFVIAITLIASSIIIQKQLHFIQNKDLGYEMDYRLMIPLRTPEAKDQYEVLKQNFQQIAGVRVVSASTSLPSTPLLRDFSVYTEGNDMQQAQHHYICNIDEGYFKLLNIPVITGRELKKELDGFDMANDASRVMVNRMSLKKLGISEEQAAGSKIMWTGKLSGENSDRTITFEIVGVVEDFHYASLHSGIDPVVFILPESSENFLFVGLALEPEAYKNAMPQLEAIWKNHVPATPFESQFLSDQVERQYENDRQVSMVITLFTGIAIGISCLGLYGLSVFVSERRIKEIGVRKVLGASTMGIIKMLSLEFILLVLVAFVIALPAGLYAMDQWLQNFAYKTEVNVITFLIAGLISFAIAWITVGFEAMRAASSNPVNSLRND